MSFSEELAQKHFMMDDGNVSRLELIWVTCFAQDVLTRSDDGEFSDSSSGLFSLLIFYNCGAAELSSVHVFFIVLCVMKINQLNNLFLFCYTGTHRKDFF